MPGEAELIAQAAAKAGNTIAGTFQFFDSMAKEKKAKAALASLRDPFYKIQDEYFENQNLGRGLAQGGMPAASKDYYTQESQRGLGAGIGGTLQAGGSPNDIAKLFSIYDQGIDRTAAQDADQHLKNISYYMGVNKDMAAQKNIQFGFNEVRPYERNFKRLTQQQSAAEQNKWNAINQVVGGTNIQNGAPQTPTDGSSNPLLEKLFATTPNSNLSNGFPMYVDPRTGLAANDSASNQVAGRVGRDVF